MRTKVSGFETVGVQEHSMVGMGWRGGVVRIACLAAMIVSHFLRLSA